MTNTTRPSAAASLGLLVLRVVVGAVFAAHGAQKIFEYTLSGTIGSFAGMGIPLPEIAAPVVAFIELIGGILLALGLFTRPVGILLAIDMIVALFAVPSGWPLGRRGRLRVRRRSRRRGPRARVHRCGPLLARRRLPARSGSRLAQLSVRGSAPRGVPPSVCILSTVNRRSP
ncbi:DoxX family protein [Microbacterium sp. NPDC090014]|uniref:DoxX family protein n=1 Tax=Microbacterium sp. NPDC090014 TaxID=3364205 RepID=UPI00381DCE1B